VRDDLVGRYSSAVEVLEELQLAGLEAAYLPVDSIDGSDLVIPDEFARSRQEGRHSRKLQMQGARILRNEAYMEVRRSDER
jgi:hypothetical protein